MYQQDVANFKPTKTRYELDVAKKRCEQAVANTQAMKTRHKLDAVNI